jgi:hypothetical protein
MKPRMAPSWQEFASTIDGFFVRINEVLEAVGESQLFVVSMSGPHAVTINTPKGYRSARFSGYEEMVLQRVYKGKRDGNILVFRPFVPEDWHGLELEAKEILAIEIPVKNALSRLKGIQEVIDRIIAYQTEVDLLEIRRDRDLMASKDNYGEEYGSW